LAIPGLRQSYSGLAASGMLADIERQLEHHATGRYSADYRHPMRRQENLWFDDARSEKKRMSIVEKFMTMEYGPAPEDPREGFLPGWTVMAGASGISLTARGRRPRLEFISTRRILPREKNSRPWRKAPRWTSTAR